MRHGYLLACLCFSTVAWAQAGLTDSSTKLSPVTIAFYALDHDKHTYADLKSGDLTVLDNKKPVRSIISLKKGSDLPLRLGFLVDASASQRTSKLYQPGLRAATDFLNQILKSPDDRVFVVKVTAIPEASEFMSKAQLLNYKLNVVPQGGTALYDGVGIACDSTMKSAGTEPSRRVLIVLSDGNDNLSHIPRGTAIEKALQAGVIIFPVSTEDQWSAYAYGEKGDSTLAHFADETGGAAFVHLTPKTIDQSFLEIAAAINDMYVVTFGPVDVGAKGLHRIELKGSGKNKVQFRAPKGFYVQ